MNWTGLIILSCIVLAVDIAWINIDLASFNSWGWLVVMILGFAGGIFVGTRG